MEIETNTNSPCLTNLQECLLHHGKISSSDDYVITHGVREARGHLVAAVSGHFDEHLESY